MDCRLPPGGELAEVNPVGNVIKVSSRPTREFWEIPVLFEDASLLALAKPDRLLTSPDRYHPERPSLMKLLHADIARGAPWAKERKLEYLANTHRLDFETSGILLLAKSKPALVKLADQFGSERPHQTYLALVHGAPAEPAFIVGAKLSPNPVRTGVMQIDPKEGKKARTEFELAERFAGYSLMRCQPLTFRPHQIRVHLKSMGLPIVGDELYGGRPLWLSRLKRSYRLKPGRVEKALIERVALHAWQFTFVHPDTGQMTEIMAPWPHDLELAVKYLRRYAPALSAAPAVAALSAENQ